MDGDLFDDLDPLPELKEAVMRHIDDGTPSGAQANEDAAVEVAVASSVSQPAATGGASEDVKGTLLRVLEEFEKFKRRADKKEEAAVSRVRDEILRDMLAVLDDLERAVEYTDAEHDAVAEGLKLVISSFVQRLGHWDVRGFESLGESFDSARHDAVSSEPSDEHPPGTVIRVLKRGYHIGDRLLRPAHVIVSKEP